jgi:hypothetical protein
METRPVGESNEAVPPGRPSKCLSLATKEIRIRGPFLLDTSLSSSAIPEISSRHSVTSRIHFNYLLLSHLTFSTRHLNATPQKRKTVEKFNTCCSPFYRQDFSKVIAGTYNPRELPFSKAWVSRRGRRWQR